jgi:hypothetical protein
MQFALEDAGFQSLLDAGFQGFGGDASTDNTPDYIKELLPVMPDIKLMNPSDYAQMGAANARDAREAMFDNLSQTGGMFAGLQTVNKLDTGIFGGRLQKGTEAHDKFVKFTKDFNRAYYQQNVDKSKYNTYQDWVDDVLGTAGSVMEAGGQELLYETKGGEVYPSLNFNLKGKSGAINAELYYDFHNLSDKEFHDKHAGSLGAKEVTPEKLKEVFGSRPEFDYFNEYFKFITDTDKEYYQLAKTEHLGKEDYWDYEYNPNKKEEG